jgi:hypothetical protein
VRIFVDGNVVRKLDEIPQRFHPYVRKKLEIYATALMAANLGGQAPILRLYTTTGTSTETVPGGYNFAEIQGWGPGAGGASVFSPGTLGGGGGGGGAYSTVTISAATQGGKTFIVVVGTGGTQSVSPGGGSVFAGTTQISAGSVTGWSTVTLRGASSGANQNGGGGGTATNANSGASNQTGNNGTSAVGPLGGNAGAGIAGDVANDGSPYGAGGKGGGSNGTNGSDGAAAFYYTP